MATDKDIDAMRNALRKFGVTDIGPETPEDQKTEEEKASGEKSFAYDMQKAITRKRFVYATKHLNTRFRSDPNKKFAIFWIVAGHGM